MAAVPLNQYVAEFLRDAQYRIGELTQEMFELRDEGSFLYAEKYDQRRALITFMEIVYDNYALFVDSGYNFLSASLDDTHPAWTDREIRYEIDYLRAFARMAQYPYLVFTGYYPEIIGNIMGSGGGSGPGWNPPVGDYLEILRYDISGTLIPIAWPDYAGMRNLTIDEYFAGR